MNPANQTNHGDRTAELLPPRRTSRGQSPGASRNIGTNDAPHSSGDGPATQHPLLPVRRRWQGNVPAGKVPGNQTGQPTFAWSPPGNQDRAALTIPAGESVAIRPLVDERTVRVRDQGRLVELAAKPPAESLRHRILVNLVAMIFCISILFLAFWLAINGYI